MEYTNIVNKERLGYFFDQIYNKYLSKAKTAVQVVNVGTTKYEPTNGVITLPAYENTTYSIAGGTNKITVTPSNGSAYDVTITPSIANNVTGSGLTANAIVLGNGSSSVKTSSKTIETTLTATSDATIPTSKAIATYVTSQMASVLTYKGTVGTGGTVTSLPASHKVGDTYVVKTAGTFAGKACEVGDYIICNTTGTTANDAHWDVVNGENQVTNASATLAWGTSTKIATVDGTDITVSLPAKPDANTDTKVTSVDNHYTPAADTNAEITATLEGTATEYKLSTQYTVVTGIKAQRDAKGHVTGITYTAANVKDTNTTYAAFKASGSSAATGLVPKPATTAGTTKFLCENATWATPDYTTITIVSEADIDDIINNADN